MKIFYILVILFTTVRFSFSQWNFDPAINTGICTEPNEQQDVRIVSDSKGGAIMTWVDFRSSNVTGDIFVQRIDKNGIVKWTVQGIALCADGAFDQGAPSIVESGIGSAIVVWNDFRSTSRDIYAQKVDSLGVVQWTANGVPVIAKASHQQDAKLISDGAGGAIIVWQDSINGAWDIYAQRINNAGSIMWPLGGTSLCSSPDAQINPRIETDGTGGAIVVWQDKRNGLDYDIYAQRIDALGVVQWAANGIVLCNSAGTQSNPKIESDGSAGAVIAWQDKRNGLDYNVYAQRVNSAGQIQWTANGVAVCTAAASQSAVDITTDAINGTILTWKDLRSGNYDVYAQKIDPAGVMQWAANGIAIGISPGAQLNPNIVGDGLGGAIIAWQDSSMGSSDIKSQRINASGTVQWVVNGITVGSAADDQVSPKNIPDGTGGSIYAWQDKRNEIDFDVYANRINADGTVASVYGPNYLTESKCFPNPIFTSAFIEIMHSGKTWNEDIEFLLVDMLGKEVKISFTGSDNGIAIFKGDIKPGVYTFRILENNNLLSVGKVVFAE